MFFIKELDNGEFIIKVRGDDSQFETSWEEYNLNEGFLEQVLDFVNQVIEKDK